MSVCVWDERAYHAARHTLNPSACVFEGAILAACAQCDLSRRRALADREVLSCTSEVAHINCTTLASLFRERATFALRLPRSNVPVAHGQAMKLQCGGLRGLQAALAAPTLDVHAMVQQAKRNDASLLDLPWHDIVCSIASWQAWRRVKPAGA